MGDGNGPPNIAFNTEEKGSGDTLASLTPTDRTWAGLGFPVKHAWGR